MPLPSMKDIEPAHLSLKSPLKFRCHKGVKCFTKCCRNINIFLTPFDIVRLKKRLNMTSSEFLDKHTRLDLDPKTSHPFAILKLLDDKEKSCPFVTPEGCTVYSDRPANCRYYPVGQGTVRKDSETGPVNEEFYFLIREPHCLGFEEDVNWTIESWKADQGVDVYDEMNKEWKEIQLRKPYFGKPLEPPQQNQVFMASYDLDSFRKYVFESKFLDVFDIPPEEIERVKNDEVALMKLAFKYIKFILMLEETLKLKKK
ncbi:MAG TPA: YkgJ family cysteine cluster protein [Thermodesulfovibrionales bacterium]|nr:YkgJ family cysteine cluster protein [Thermodesulfovibrionales bacterium]